MTLHLILKSRNYRPNFGPKLGQGCCFVCTMRWLTMCLHQQSDGHLELIDELDAQVLTQYYFSKAGGAKKMYRQMGMDHLRTLLLKYCEKFVQNRPGNFALQIPIRVPEGDHAVAYFPAKSDFGFFYDPNFGVFEAVGSFKVILADMELLVQKNYGHPTFAISQVSAAVVIPARDMTDWEIKAADLRYPTYGMQMVADVLNARTKLKQFRTKKAENKAENKAFVAEMMKLKPERCMSCGGSGWSTKNGFKSLCNICHGSGSIYKHDEPPLDFQSFQKVQRKELVEKPPPRNVGACPRCHSPLDEIDVQFFGKCPACGALMK
jgi:hypothetical protein